MQHFSPDLLRRYRVQAGLSREALAVTIGRSFSSVVLYESGAVCPPTAIVGVIADALGVEAGDLFDRETVPA